MSKTFEDLTDEERKRAWRNSSGFTTLYPDFAPFFLEDDVVTENRKKEQQASDLTL